MVPGRLVTPAQYPPTSVTITGHQVELLSPPGFVKHNSEGSLG